MNVTIFLPLISAILVFFLGFFVFMKGKRDRVNFTFALFAFAITIWMLGTFMMFLNKDDISRIIFWDKFVYFGVVYIPVIMYHFGLALTRNKLIKSKILLVSGYILSTFFLLLIPTKLFVSGTFVYQWGVHTKAQLFHHVFLVYFVLYILAWFVIVYKYYKSSISSIERERIKYCFLAFFVLATIGSLGYLPAYGIGIYPFAYISGVIFVIILAYAIVVHRLMDIKMVMRKSSVYLASFSLIAFIAITVKYIFIRYFTEFSGWIDPIILFLAILVFSPIKNYFYRLANKYFFSSLYDSRELIADVSDKLRSTLEVKKVYNFIHNTLSGAFHFKAFGILGYDEKTGNYIAQYNRGFNIGQRRKFPSNVELHKVFIGKDEPIIVEEVKNANYNKKTKDVIDLLVSLDVDILTPLNIKDKTIGLIALGQKESGDMYNDEDLQILKTIGAQAAIAIENALLYEETRNFGIKLEKEVEKATQKLRSANEELKKLDVAKSEFISIASHQLRTPLTVIKGYISMILEGNFGELTPGERESLEKVYDSGERLIQLVENLLNISRIESGRLQFDYEIVQIEEIVDSVVEELTRAAGKKGLRLDYKKPAKPLPKLKIDEEKIRQVILNLIDNAIKYTKKGGVTVGLKKSGSDIELCVSDSGMGIKKEDKPNLFKKFSRGHGTSIVHTEGTGLGLYVAYEMIVAHKGKIWAESKGEGKGSKFCFELPIKN